MGLVQEAVLSSSRVAGITMKHSDVLCCTRCMRHIVDKIFARPGFIGCMCFHVPYQCTLPVINDLLRPSLRPRHWKQVVRLALPRRSAATKSLSPEEIKTLSLGRFMEFRLHGEAILLQGIFSWKPSAEYHIVYLNIVVCACQLMQQMSDSLLTELTRT